MGINWVEITENRELTKNLGYIFPFRYITMNSIIISITNIDSTIENYLLVCRILDITVILF